MKNEALQGDIRWINGVLLPYLGPGYHMAFTLDRLLKSDEMKNIVSSYGMEELYKQDLERIIEMAEMLI